MRSITHNPVLQLSALSLALLFAQPSMAQDAPEAASGIANNKVSVQTKKFMAATANPYATDAADEILKKGGSAVDAAIAAQMVLGLTEPQSSGPAGGAFLLTYDGKKVTNYDGREVAPSKVDEKLFQTSAGAEMAFYDAVVGGKSVGVPGVVAMLELAHKREGKLPWATLFQPAIRLAEQGFKVSPRLNSLLAGEKYLNKDEAARVYFYQADGVTPKAVGTVLQNPEYARTLKTIATKGRAGFYKGEIAQAIVDKVNKHPTNPGTLSMADMGNYQAKIRTPVCGGYHELTICGPAAPSSGGVAVLQTLGMLERFNLKSFEPNDPQAIHYYLDAGSYAFADRGQYLADPDFVHVPTQALISKEYLAQRSALIKDNVSIAGKATPGVPKEMRMAARLDIGSPEQISTTNISIVDQWGHAVSMTTSIEDQFGSRQFVKGMLLNNQLTDFNFTPVGKDGAKVANRVQANKRPRSSMSPVIVLGPKGELKMVVGSPGGSRIISYVAQTLVNMIDWNMDPQKAIDTGHYISRNNGNSELEKGRIWPEATVAALKAKGHNVTEGETVSGTSAIVKTATGYIGGADSRREGTVKGE